METEAERLARIRENLALYKKDGRDSEIAEYLATERAHVQKTTRPEQNVWEKALPVIETFLSGVPGANKAVSGLRGLTDIYAGNEPDVAGEQRSQRENINRFREEHPKTALGLELASSLSLPIPKAGLGERFILPQAGGKRFLEKTIGRIGEKAGRIGTTAIVGGGLQGASSADLQGTDAGDGAARGGATAAVVTGAMMGAGKLGKAIISPFLTPNAQASAVEKVRSLVQKEYGDDIAGVYNAAQDRRTAGGEPLLFELLGDQGKRTLRASVTAPFSKGGEVAGDALNARAAKVADRADDAVLKGAGISGDDPGMMVDRMAGERANLSRPLYEQAREEAAAAAAGPYASKGPAMTEIRRQLKKNTLLRTLVNDTKQLPDLVDARPDSYEVLDDAYKAINARIQGAKAANDPDLARRFDALRKPLLNALSEVAPSYRQAATTFAKESVPLNSFEAGVNFRKLDPYEIKKALGTGTLANGTDVDPAAFRAGVAQDLRALIGGKAGSESLAGAATHKNPLATLNNRELDRQLTAALGDEYQSMIPTFREILREEGNRAFVTGGSNTANKALDDPDLTGTVLGHLAGGIGFGPIAAARRAGLAGARELLEPIARGQVGKRATETAKALTVSGSQLDDLLRMLGKSPAEVPASTKRTLLGRTPAAIARLLADHAAR